MSPLPRLSLEGSHPTPQKTRSPGHKKSGLRLTVIFSVVLPLPKSLTTMTAIAIMIIIIKAVTTAPLTSQSNSSVRPQAG